jgi:restriction endonuclease fold toxin 2 of polymorphic toxin system
VWADGIDTSTGYAIETKYVDNPGRSPYVPGSNAPEFLFESVGASQEIEFARYGMLIADESNPITGLMVITNTAESAAYFQQVMNSYNIPGGVTITP